MFAIAALIVFAVAMLGGHLGAVNLLYLGLALIAAHLVWDPIPWPWHRRQP